MEVVKDYPPNYEDIKAVLQIAGRDSIVFTYGDKLYNPSDAQIADHLMVHEETHRKQQSQITPQEWWRKYLADEKFRLDEELLAYRLQYRFMKTKGYPRNYRRDVLNKIAKDLAGKMYGHIISRDEAKRLIAG
jgi:hypothetical protein